MAEKHWFLDRPIEEYSWTNDGIYTASNGEKMFLPHHKHFQHWINQYFDRYRLIEGITQTCEKTTKEPSLYLYQQFIADYMAPHRPYRGILLYHGLGSGKTRTAITTAEQYRVLGVPIIVILPATLKSTWINELKLWARKTDIGRPDIGRPDNYQSLSEQAQREWENKSNQLIDQHYHFISSNAPNTLEQLDRIVGIGQSPKHSLIIVDEVHNLISMMMNPKGRVGPPLYDRLMNVIDCKMLFLSGTPLINRPLELARMFNLLKGPIGSNHETLFPIDEDEFNQIYVDNEANDVRNPNLFKARIAGMVSYYYGKKGHGIYAETVNVAPTSVTFSDDQFEHYAHVRYEEIRQEAQRRNRLARQKKIKETSQTSRNEDVHSTFRMGSRLACNFSFPKQLIKPSKYNMQSLNINYLIDPTQWTPDQQKYVRSIINQYYDLGEEKEYLQFIETYRDKNIKQREQQLSTLFQDVCIVIPNLAEIVGDNPFIYQRDIYADSMEQKRTKKRDKLKMYELGCQHVLSQLSRNKDLYLNKELARWSPKMEVIYRMLMEGHGSNGIAFVYSHFITLEGIKIFGLVLEAHGFIFINQLIENRVLDTPKQLNELIHELNEKPQLRYGIYSGLETIETRNKLIKILNHPSNLHGEICKVFMGTSASAEGISLKNILQIHIMEPHWNEPRIQQVIGRGRRIKSHCALIEEAIKTGKDVKAVTMYIYRYHMHLTKKQQDSIGESLSTDEVIYQIALNKAKISNRFIQLLKDGAVDCTLNLSQNRSVENPINCFMFSANAIGLSWKTTISKEDLDSHTSIRTKTINVGVTELKQIAQDLKLTLKKDNKWLYVYRTDEHNRELNETICFIGSKGSSKEITGLIIYYNEDVTRLEQLRPAGAIVTVSGKPTLISAKHFKLGRCLSSVN